MLGGILALLAAATFAANNVLARRGVVSGSVFQALAITIPIGVPLFLLAVLLTGSFGELWRFSIDGYVFLALAGIVHFVWGRYCLYRSTKAMGANLTGPVQQVALIVALVLAIVLLGEKLTPLRLIGLALVIGGPILIFTGKEDGEKSEKKNAGKATDFVPNYTEGYTWALLSATGTGISPILVRYGLENTNVGAGLCAGLISYTAATLVFIVVLLVTGRVAHCFDMDGRNARWFAYAGFFVFLSQMLRYLAFVFAPVTVVTPLQRLTVLFRMYFGWLLNREYEVFEPKVIWATVVSVIGAIALSMSTDIVIDNVPMPQWLIDFARMEWP
ncbi:MAG: hypothetical protein RLZ98_3029 [Pseudomonadota bacterium]